MPVVQKIRHSRPCLLTWNFWSASGKHMMGKNLMEYNGGVWKDKIKNNNSPYVWILSSAAQKIRKCTAEMIQKARSLKLLVKEPG